MKMWVSRQKGPESSPELHPEHYHAFFITMFFLPKVLFVGPATTQTLVVRFDGGICGGVLVEDASDDFPKQKKLENLLPSFAGSSPPISPKTSPTSLWKSLVPKKGLKLCLKLRVQSCENGPVKNV